MNCVKLLSASNTKKSALKLKLTEYIFHFSTDRADLNSDSRQLNYTSCIILISDACGFMLKHEIYNSYVCTRVIGIHRNYIQKKQKPTKQKNPVFISMFLFFVCSW